MKPYEKNTLNKEYADKMAKKMFSSDYIEEVQRQMKEAEQEAVSELWTSFYWEPKIRKTGSGVSYTRSYDKGTFNSSNYVFQENNFAMKAELDRKLKKLQKIDIKKLGKKKAQKLISMIYSIKFVLANLNTEFLSE